MREEKGGRYGAWQVRAAKYKKLIYHFDSMFEKAFEGRDSLSLDQLIDRIAKVAKADDRIAMEIRLKPDILQKYVDQYIRRHDDCPFELVYTRKSAFSKFLKSAAVYASIAAAGLLSAGCSEGRQYETISGVPVEAGIVEQNDPERQYGKCSVFYVKMQDGQTYESSCNLVDFGPKSAAVGILRQEISDGYSQSVELKGRWRYHEEYLGNGTKIRIPDNRFLVEGLVVEGQRYDF